MEENYDLDEEFPVNNEIEQSSSNNNLDNETIAMQKLMKKVTNVKTEEQRKKILEEMQYEMNKIKNAEKDPKQKLKEKLLEMKKNRNRK